MSGGARLQRGINAFIQRQSMEGARLELISFDPTGSVAPFSSRNPLVGAPLLSVLTCSMSSLCSLHHAGWSRDKKFSKMTGASREPPAYERRRLVCWNNKRVQTREALQYLTLGKYSRSTYVFEHGVVGLFESSREWNFECLFFSVQAFCALLRAVS